MRCAKCRELISNAFDEDLTERDRGRLVDHLAECADCRQHHAVLEQGRILFEEGLVEAPENFEWKVQLGIQRALRDGVATIEEVRFGWAFWSRTAASAAAMAALVLVAGSFLLRPGGDAAPTPGLAGGGDSAGLVALESASAENAVPDLSGARPVTDFEVDAFRDGYGIRTVADQTNFGRAREYYPMAGRRLSTRGVTPYATDTRANFSSQVLHLRIVPTKLRSSVAPATEKTSGAAASAVDSAATAIQPRR